jgi:hypothetical protein
MRVGHPASMWTILGDAQAGRGSFAGDEVRESVAWRKIMMSENPNS